MKMGKHESVSDSEKRVSHTTEWEQLLIHTI